MEDLKYTGRHISIKELENFANKKLNEISNLEDIIVDYLWEQVKDTEHVTASS